MGSDETKRPVVPSEGTVKDWPTCRKWMASVKQLIEIHEGLRGLEEIDRFVKLGELGSLVPQEVDFVDIITSDDAPPNPPTNFSATKRAADGSASFKIYLSWKNPTDTDLSYVEIWVATSNNRNAAGAAKIKLIVLEADRGQTQTYNFMPDSPTYNYYFWIRAVDYADNVSTWNPSSATAGLEVAGETSVGEFIDQIMAILRGEGAPAYDPAGTYFKYDIVSYYNGVYTAKYQVYEDNGGTGITGIAPPPPTVASDYWRLTGLVLEDYVEGVPTVGIDGRLVVDKTIYARSIVTDGLIVGDNVTIENGAIRIAHIGDDAAILNLYQQWDDVLGDKKPANYADVTATKFKETLANIDQGTVRANSGLDSDYRITKAVKGSVLTGTPTAADLWLTGTYFGYYNGDPTAGGGTGWPVYIKNNGEFWFGKDANNYFAYTGGSLYLKATAENALRIYGGGALKVYDGGSIYLNYGGDIVFTARDSNPSEIQWRNASGTILQRCGGNAAGHLYFYPETSHSKYFLVGYVFGNDPVDPDLQPYNIVGLVASNWALLRGNAASIQLKGSATPQALFSAHLIPMNTQYDIGSPSEDWRDGHFSGTLTVLGTIANFSMPANGVITSETSLSLNAGDGQYSFTETQFRPNLTTHPDLGTETKYWNDVWAKGNNIALDFFYMDDWKNPVTGEIESVDDIHLISAIKPSGAYDKRTGFQLIDDDSVPASLLVRHSKNDPEQKYVAGDVAKTADGKPYMAVTTALSLLMGAVRQIDSRLIQLESKGAKQ